MSINCDVAVIGGGPAGCTVSGFLKKYAPTLDVVVVEQEIFPRDHVGESLLPRLMRILYDLGAWDKVESAGFAVKVGATYRWGNTDNLWNFDFIPGGDFKDVPRPSKYEGQRTMTAFQVDRSIYDKILMDHVREMGVRIFEDVRVVKVEHEGDTVTGLSVEPNGEHGSKALEGNTAVQARHYVDASGSSGLLRRALGVDVFSPTTLRNIAIWDYWQNAEWAEHIGIGGTRIQVMSLGWGWIWFIPLGPSRTSIGLVTPAEYLKNCGKKPEDLYLEAIQSEPRISKLVKSAQRECILKATKDWNYVADRLTGKNWFLTGDAGGFADPILSAGLTLAQTGALKVANCILELERGALDPEWLKADYSESHLAQIRNHMVFADYWYSANTCFTDLKEYCSEIAKGSGLTLDAESAFWWLGTGGFARDDLGAASAAHCRVGAIRYTLDKMSGKSTTWAVETGNTFKLVLDGSERVLVGNHEAGAIIPVESLKRGNSLLPLYRGYGAMVEALNRETELGPMMERFVFELRKTGLVTSFEQCFWIGIETLEALVAEGWVEKSFDSSMPVLRIVPSPLRFWFGWWQEGVGISSVDPAQQGKLLLTADQMDSMRSEMYPLPA